jgi:hypothetical protein
MPSSNSFAAWAHEHGVRANHRQPILRLFGSPDGLRDNTIRRILVGYVATVSLRSAVL